MSANCKESTRIRANFKDIYTLAQYLEPFLTPGMTMDALNYRLFWESLGTDVSTSDVIALLLAQIILEETNSPDIRKSFHQVIGFMLAGTWIALEPAPDSDMAISLTVESVMVAKRKRMQGLLLTLSLVVFYYDFDDQDANLSAMRKLGDRYSEKLGVYTRDLLSMLQPGGIDLDRTILRVLESSTNADELQGGAGSRIYDSLQVNYLFRRLAHADKVSALMDRMIVFLQHPQILPFERLGGLLHLCRIILEQSPRKDRGRVERLAEVLKTYLLWPAVLSNQARTIIELCLQEISAPGCLYSAFLLRNCPELWDKQSTGKERMVHLLIDQKGVYGQSILAMMSNSSHPVMSAPYFHALQLLSILENHLGEACPSLDMTGFDPMEVEVFYRKAVDVVGQAQARQDCTVQLLDLVASIQSSSSAAPQQWTYFRDRRLAPLDYDVLPLTCDPSSQHTKFCSEKRYPYVSAMDIITQVLSKYADLTVYQEERVPVRLAICGGDIEFHQIILCYASLVYQQDAILDKIDLQLYFVPLEGGNLKTYLCQRDPWYAQHIALCLEGILGIVPAVDPAVDMTQPEAAFNRGSASGLMTPQILLAHMLDRYVYDGNHVMYLYMYDCELTLATGIITVPFVLSVEMGIRAYDEGFKCKNNLEREVDHTYLVNQAKVLNYKAMPPSLEIKYTPLSLTDDTKQLLALEAASFQHASIANMPCGSHGHCAHPESAALVLECEEVESKKKNRIRVSSYICNCEVEARGNTYDVLIDGVVYGDVMRTKITMCMHPITQEPLRIPLRNFMKEVKA